MPTIFSKIIAGEIPCHKVAETENHLAFLDIRPLVEGHTLVIPKQELDYIFDMEDDALAGLMIFAKKVSRALETVIPCKKIGIAVIGLEVPHVHIHLAPINHVGDINFAKPALQLSADQLAEIATKASRKYKALFG